MAWFDSHLLSFLVFLPLVWAVPLLAFPGGKKGGKALMRYWALAGALVTFFVSLLLYVRYNPGGAEFQFMERMEWLPALGISYNVGMDGISLWLILLTTFLAPLVVLGSFKAVEDREREY